MRAIQFSIIIFLGLILIWSVPAWAGRTNAVVNGYKRPAICDDTNIRCLLRSLGTKTYWCLKSNIQRNFDTRYNGHITKKTTRHNLGHCAKIIPADKVE